MINEQLLTLRLAQKSDIPFLFSLREQTMSQHLTNSGMHLDADAQMARVMYRFDCAKIIVLNGIDVGLLKLNTNANPWELNQLQISPTHQGNGLGERIIRLVLREAKECDIDVELGVLKANPARSLYERLGFIMFSENESQYFLKWTVR